MPIDQPPIMTQGRSKQRILQSRILLTVSTMVSLDSHHCSWQKKKRLLLLFFFFFFNFFISLAMNQPHRTLEAMLDDDSPYARYDPAKNSLVKISSKSFLLGVVFTGALIGELTHPRLIPLCLYLQFLCIFHSLEFGMTYLYNNSQTDDDSFILEDREFHLITVISIVEYLVSPFHLHVVPIGLLLALLGQLVRTLSMGTAQESFNHYIQKSGKETHTLVTQGVYKYIRHPSYFGFFIWFVGLELLLGNILILVVGGIILWRFFRDRIRYEEEYLIKMFGADYQSYRANTKTWLYI